MSGAVGARRMAPNSRPLARLAPVARAPARARGHITLIAVDERIVRIEAGEWPRAHLGNRVRYRTTTVVGYLTDLETGAQLPSLVAQPTDALWRDVSRALIFGQKKRTFSFLQRDIVQALNKIIVDTTQPLRPTPRTSWP
jgi:hypothetical protein